MQNYRLVLVLGVLGAGCWQLVSDRSERAIRGPHSEPRPEVSVAEVAREGPISAATDAPSPVETHVREDPGLASFVDAKYRYLQTQSAALRNALQQREALAIRLNTMRQARVPPDSVIEQRAEEELARADERMRELMHPAEYAEYALLRDANVELAHLRQYIGGISNLLPLTHEEERAVLFAKLTYKHQYERALLDSGLERTDMPVWQRLYAYERIAQAARDYRSNFLQQAHQSLHSEDQLTLLSNYEHTELDRELARLRLAALRQ